MNMRDVEHHRATFLAVIGHVTSERIRSGHPESHRDRAKYVVEVATEIADRAVHERLSPVCSDEMLGFACTAREISVAFEQLAETIEKAVPVPEKTLTQILEAVSTMLAELDRYSSERTGDV